MSKNDYYNRNEESYQAESLRMEEMLTERMKRRVKEMMKTLKELDAMDVSGKLADFLFTDKNENGRYQITAKRTSYRGGK